MFDPREDRYGERLLFTRWDILLSVILAVAWMAALAYSAEQYGWTTKRALVVGGITLFSLLATRHSRVVVGCALALVAMRATIGLFSGSHPMILLLISLTSGGMAWLLLKNLR